MKGLRPLTITEARVLAYVIAFFILAIGAGIATAGVIGL